MFPQDRVEKEEEILEEQLAEGGITQDEFNKAIRELHRDYAAEAEQSAQDAHDRELERW